MTQFAKHALTVVKGNPAMAPAKVAEALGTLVSAARDYAKTREEENTKRLAIAARLQTELARIQCDTETLQLAIQNTFQLRTTTAEGLLKAFDHAHEQGDHTTSLKALDALVGLASDCPLKALADFHRARQGENFEF
jgi:hypothetical protein